MSTSIGPNNKSQKLIRAYYTEAACDLGLVDTRKGLIFGHQPNTSSGPSEKLMAIMAAAESSPTAASAALKLFKASSSKNKLSRLRKFEHLTCENTREVIRKARKEESDFVFPHDFPVVGDVEFLLYKQVVPFKPSAMILDRILSRRKIRNGKNCAHLGLCCRYCARVHGTESYHSGMFLPTNRNVFMEFAFTYSLQKHVTKCCYVPQEIKDAIEELKSLASEHRVLTKRGSKKQFLEKVWGRIETHAKSY